MQFKFKWWQLIPYELALLCLGVVVGAYWHYFFSDLLYPLLLVFLLCGAYVLYVMVNQVKFDDQ